MTFSQIFINENSLVVQWLELWAFTAKGTGSIHGWEIRSCKPWYNKKKKKKTLSNGDIFASKVFFKKQAVIDRDVHPVCCSSIPFPFLTNQKLTAKSLWNITLNWVFVFTQLPTCLPLLRLPSFLRTD